MGSDGDEGIRDLRLVASDPMTQDESHEIALTLDEWAVVVAGMAYATNLPDMPADELEAYRDVAAKLADACPQGSVAWLGKGMLG